MIARRTFLKTVSGAVAGLLGLQTVAKAKLPTKVEEPIIACGPACVFNNVLMTDGYTTEFPKDFLRKSDVSKTLFIADGNGRIVEDKNGLDWVYVPTFCIGASGKTQLDVKIMYHDKVKRWCGQILLNAAMAGGTWFVSNSRATLIKQIRECFPGGTKIVEYAGHIIGVDASRGDSLVMPVRKAFDVYPDPTTGEHYGYSDVGICVLDASVLVAGKIRK